MFDPDKPHSPPSLKSTHQPTQPLIISLGILDRVLLCNAPQEILLTALLHLTSNQQLVEDEIRLLEIKDNIQLADVAVIFVHLLDVAVHDFQRDKLVISAIDTGHEEEGSVTAVDYFHVYGEREREREVSYVGWRVGLVGGEEGGGRRKNRTLVFEEVTHAGSAGEHELRDLADNFGFFLRAQSGEPF